MTAISGEQSKEATKTLLSFTGPQEWSELFPPMKHYYNNPGVTTTSTSLIVAGGWGLDQMEAAVEVLDTETWC